MSNLIFLKIKHLRSSTFGLGDYCLNSSLIKFGFGSPYLSQNNKVFNFVSSSRIDLTFSERLTKSLTNLVLANSSEFNVVLSRKIARRIELLKFNRSWRGVRHFYSLPVRGQRTKTNARTRKLRRKKT